MAGRKLSPQLIVALAVAHLIVTSITWRDIRNRSEDQIRGSKRFWRVFSCLNMGNSVIYWLVGRKKLQGNVVS